MEKVDYSYKWNYPFGRVTQKEGTPTHKQIRVPSVCEWIYRQTNKYTDGDRNNFKKLTKNKYYRQG
jgi:hypothetical protein